MTEQHYVLRVVGDVHRARLVAREDGLAAEVTPETITAFGWLPDQAALFGWLARARSHGLEVVSVHRWPGPRADSGRSEMPAIQQAEPAVSLASPLEDGHGPADASYRGQNELAGNRVGDDGTQGESP